MDLISQIGLQSLMGISDGDPNTVIGIIDGLVDLDHPAFQKSNINTIRDSQFTACKNASSIACSHDAFTAGILCAKRGLPASAICPSCKVIFNPIFKENMDRTGEKAMERHLKCSKKHTRI